jgi:hypothetical protein
VSYHYWVVRFVPDVARGEFTNIGLVCGRDGADWWSQFDLHGLRRRGGLSADLRELHPWVAWMQHRVRGVAELDDEDPNQVDGGWLNALRARQAGSVQISEPMPVDSPTARAGVELLFPLLVARGGPRRRATQTRQSMRATVRDALLSDLDLQLQPGRTLLDRPRVSVGLQSGQFDLGLRPDDETQFANVWAFNIAALDDLERDIRSWNYIVGRLRQDGGELRAGRRRPSPVPNDAPIDVIVDSPEAASTQRSRDIFAAANEAWNLNDVRVHTLQAYIAEIENGGVLSNA